MLPGPPPLTVIVPPPAPVGCRLIVGLWRSGDRLLGFAGIIVSLAVVSAIPFLNLLSLGCFLKAPALVGKSGRLRDGFIGIIVLPTARAPLANAFNVSLSQYLTCISHPLSSRDAARTCSCSSRSESKQSEDAVQGDGTKQSQQRRNEAGAGRSLSQWNGSEKCRLRGHGSFSLLKQRAFLVPAPRLGL
jgi:hypothetical protein